MPFILGKTFIMSKSVSIYQHYLLRHQPEFTVCIQRAGLGAGWDSEGHCRAGICKYSCCVWAFPEVEPPNRISVFRIPLIHWLAQSCWKIIKCLPSFKRKEKIWFQFWMHRVRNPEVTSLSLELSLTLLNKEKGYIFPWIKSNTEKTVTVKTIEFISTDIAWHWDKCLNCCHSNKCVGLMHAFSAIGFWLMALTKWCEGGETVQKAQGETTGLQRVGHSLLQRDGKWGFLEAS